MPRSNSKKTTGDAPETVRRSLASIRKHAATATPRVVKAPSDKELIAQVARNPDAAPLLTRAQLARADVIRANKEPVYLRLDADILAALRQTGKGWQTRVNAILREWMTGGRDSSQRDAHLVVARRAIEQGLEQLQRAGIALDQARSPEPPSDVLYAKKERAPLRTAERRR